MLAKTRLWWDTASLGEFLKENRVPRGLRIKKFPSFEVQDLDFRAQWTNILGEASKGLMRLLVKFKETRLESLRMEIVSTQQDLDKLRHLPDFESREEWLINTLDTLEDEITQTKRSKFLRDKSEYGEGTMYRQPIINILKRGDQEDQDTPS